MPTSEAGKTIEKMYWEHVRVMSPTEKYHKAKRLIVGVRAMVETQVRKKHPSISEREMQFAVARRRYWDEPKILQMLDKAEKMEKEQSQ